ncbi:MAG TPA: aspartate-semialdehyde dehydrogenase [Gemmatimonadaceae bacterium]|jgi:aspartate-semialdehyde dehydrogenase|nr:aspartate-semialdehyde dehydrogenase [Gemmatimonadaceae bacterium]
MTPKKWPVAVLGATGAVGQTFIRLLEDHPWFEVAEVAASERSSGKAYREAARWLEGTLPPRIAALDVLPCEPSAVRAPIVFSALDASAAETIEPAFARAGQLVFSNAKNFRMEPDVPLLVPEVNAGHLDALPVQRGRMGWSGCGAIVTNANCAATAALLPLAALHEMFHVEHVMAMTMQAISGAGYPGVPSLDILGNVIPFIGEEEEKIERELPKMLGRWTGSVIEPADIGVSAHANRVPVEHGHTVCLTIKLKTRPSVADARAALAEWRGAPAARGLPSAPERPIVLADAEARPQPRRDVWAGKGMTTVVGRVRADALWDLRLVALSHNVVRGAAGGSVLNAELLAARGGLPPA